MKIYWSAFLSMSLLFILAGCGAEQFGVTPQSNSEKPAGISSFQQASCSGSTTVNPKVDILYVVDNSTSSYYVANDIKTAIQNTIGSISSQFDYRVIGTPLLQTSAGNEDYQVLSKVPSSLGSSIPSSKIVSGASQFSFFSNIVQGNNEVGLSRINSFIAAHQTDLFRQGAYLFIVLVSNGRDNDVEKRYDVNSDTVQIESVFAERKATLLNIKNYLQNQQLRLFSVTANSSCIDGYQSSAKSYGAMSQALYNSHAGFPAKANADHYDLCQGSTISSVFSDVNSSIQQVIIPHKYNRWPITFSETPTGLNVGEIKVYKSSPTQAPTLLPSSAWTYINNSSYTSYPTRVAPSVGEPTTARHLIQFTSGNEIVYPECIQVTSTSNLEYFDHVVLNKAPKLDSIVLKINGQTISSSPSNGYSYVGLLTRNIKVSHGVYSDLPAAVRTGYMLKLNGTTNYYKSGDNVEIYYIPATN